LENGAYKCSTGATRPPPWHSQIPPKTRPARACISPSRDGPHLAQRHGRAMVGTGLEGHFVHELAHEVDAAPVRIEKVRGIGGVLDLRRVESAAMIVHAHRNLRGAYLEDEGHRLVG